MKILHIADLHLDRAFAGEGAGRAGDRRRLELRDALGRALALGRERGVDAVCLAGDVYEHEYVRADTVAFLVSSLGEAGVPVLVAPGNHDPHVPGSPWQRVRWPANVTVFAEDVPAAVELGDGVVVWGAAFTARHCDATALRAFVVPADGDTHLLLLHAALCGEAWSDEPLYRPLTRAQLRATGARFAMLGHFHDGRADDFLAYPGSPEPLGWGERHGGHGAAIVTVERGAVAVELVALARRRYAERLVSVDGASGSAEVEDALRAVAGSEQGASLLVRLAGEVSPACEIDAELLAERCGDGLAELVVRDETRPAYDLDALAGEPGIRGRFVARLRERARTDPVAADAILAGLRALDGQGDPTGAR